MMIDQERPEEKQPKISQFGTRKIAIFFSLLAIVIVTYAFGYGYFQLAKVNIALARRISSLKESVGRSETQIAVLQKSLETLTQAAQQSNTLLAEHEKRLSFLHSAQIGDIDKWQVTQAHYLVKSANNQLQFTHDTAMAMLLLRQADQLLENMQDPNLLEIRKSLASDIANLQTTPVLDVSALYLRLNTLDGQLDALPLPTQPLKATEGESWVETPLPPGLPWWKAGLERSLQTLRRIVIVRYTEKDALPLVLPEEKAFLYQNLHAQMETAMWSVLHRNAAIYQASLARTMTAIQKYFIQDANETKTVLEQLTELRSVDIDPHVANLSATLGLFDAVSNKVQSSASPE